MNRLSRLAIVAATVLGSGALATDAAQADNFSDRMANQRDRLQQGVESGDLTRQEARKLRRQQQDLNEERRDFAEDGLTDRERRVLRRDFDEQSDRIYRQRHDGQDRR
jgi:hypothetical protein